MSDIRKTAGSRSWWNKAAELMVRQNLRFLHATTVLGIEGGTDELKRVEASQEFQNLLWNERHKYYKEIAQDPNFTKDSLVGQMLTIIFAQMEENKWKDAGESILKLAKIQGYVGETGTVNIFGNLSEAQLKELEKDLDKPDERSESSTSETVSVN